jgi:hypothetical protein
MNHSKINRPRQINGLTAIQHLHGNEMAVYLAVLMAEMIVKYGKGLHLLQSLEIISLYCILRTLPSVFVN